MTYTLEGALDRLRIPAPQNAAPADRLWEHTCFELFVARRGRSAYHELNFAPDARWAVYAFDDYRAGARTISPSVNPRLAIRRTDERLELDAELDLARLSVEYARESLSVGLAAVIEDADGSLSYWALAHPAAKPDFHHRDTFTLAL